MKPRAAVTAALVRRFRLLAFLAAAALCGGAGRLLGACGPFTDVTDPTFCPFILEIFTLGITTGTTSTTFSPGDSVTRLQMAAFLSRSVDGVLRRASHRAIAGKFWTPQSAAGLTTIPNGILLGIQSDGADLWVANSGTHSIARVRASDGKFLETWTSAGGPFPHGVTLAKGRVFVSGEAGVILQIDPSQAAGFVTTVASNLGSLPQGIAFDGSRLWTANHGGSVSIVTPGLSIPWTVTTVTTGFNAPRGILYDGTDIWVTDIGKVYRLSSTGAILQTITAYFDSGDPAFDGTNLWVPSLADAVTVVRASSGSVLAMLTGNGLSTPFGAAFDGQRVLLTNFSGGSVSLWKAADLSAQGSFAIGSQPRGVCSDGLNFWVSLHGVLSPPGLLARL